jgi:hypothetical protein
VSLSESNPSSTPLAVRLRAEAAEWDRGEPITPLLAEAAEAIEHLAASVAELEFDRQGYRRALVAHHDLATLSDDVIREYDFRECPVCRRARGE